jgi:uncharacterized protein (TIGR02246 family)
MAEITCNSLSDNEFQVWRIGGSADQRIGWSTVATEPTETTRTHLPRNLPLLRRLPCLPHLPHLPRREALRRRLAHGMGAGTFPLMRALITCIVLVLSGACTPANTTPPDPFEETETLLNDAAAAWNRGDLDGFVSTYAVESTTTFVSGGEVQRGFDWIRSNYAPRFEPSAERDSLRFEDLETRALGEGHALATAHYVLFRSDSATDSGIFTLVLRRTDDGWLMIHDHTSR